MTFPKYVDFTEITQFRYLGNNASS